MSRIIVPVEDLPYPGKGGKHKVRFRITTKDYNEISEWSPIFLLESVKQVVPPTYTPEYSYDVSTTTSGRKLITLYWGDVFDNTDPTGYDVFVKWDSASYQYLHRTVSNNTSTMSPVTSSSAQFKLQLPSYPTPPVSSSTFLMFETPTIVL